MADGKPIIVIKKKGGHGGHHGGAWKIAYADFVTAMMCFFMVMWLVNTASVVTKENIASYFRRPGLFDTGSGTPLMTGQTGILDDAFAPNNNFKAGSQGGKNDTVDPGIRGDQDGNLSSYGEESDKKSEKQRAFEATSPKTEVQKGEDVPTSQIGDKEDPQNIKFGGITIDKSENAALEASSADQAGAGGSTGAGNLTEPSTEVAEFQAAASDIENLFRTSPELEQLLGQVDVKIDSDGLNIEIADSDKNSMFQLGSARIVPEAEAAFGKLGGIIGQLDNTIDIVGHTDARPFAAGDRGYSNWELSTDRANAARRSLQKQNINSDRITSVIGMADKLLRNPEDPLAAVNRRISLKIRFRVPQPTKLDSEKLDQIIKARGKEALNRPVTEPNPGTSIPSSSGSTGIESKAPSNSALGNNNKMTAHTYTPKEIIKAVKRDSKKTVPLPPERGRNYAPTPSDNVFKDAPILGAPDPFDF